MSPASLWDTVPPGIARQRFSNTMIATVDESAGNVAIHVPSVGIAICLLTVEGLHVAAVSGGGDIPIGVGILPLGQVTATVQAELLMLFVLSAVALELELLSAVLVFELAQSNRLCYNS